MIKVLYICVSGTGGSNQALLSTLKELKKKGVVPFVIVPDETTAELYKSYSCATYVIYMRQEVMPRCDSGKSLLLFLPLLVFNHIVRTISYIRLKRVCKLYNPDIIHSNITVTTLGYELAKHFNIPHVWHIREYVQRPMFGFKLLTKLLNKGNTILVTKGLQKFYHINDSNTRVIYDGVSFEVEDGVTTEIPLYKYFLYVGRITKAKGVELLIKTFTLFAKGCSTIDLLLVGEGNPEYVNLLKEQLASHNLLNRVHFVGPKSHKETMLYMKHSEALIVSSLSEGFGLITAEAMFNKCIVIGNNNTGTKEQFDNGMDMSGQEIGLRFNNPEELLDAMLLVEHNGKSYYNYMVNNAFDVVNKLYTESKNGESVYDYYKNIIKKNE